MRIIKNSTVMTNAGTELIKDSFDKILMNAMGSPIELIYYPINIEKSSIDRGLEDLGDPISPTSKLAYNKILNIIGVGFPEIVFDFNYDEETGVNYDFSGSFTLYVNTIVPNVGDFFILPVLNDPFLFRVTSVNSEKALNEPVYQLSFSIHSCDSELNSQLNKQVIDEYYFVLSKYGETNSYLIEKVKYHDTRKLVENYLDLLDLYKTIFMNSAGDLLEYRLYDDYLGEIQYHIDWVLYKFLFDKRIISCDRVEYIAENNYNIPRSTLYMEPPLVNNEKYNRTIFAAIVNKRKIEKSFTAPKYILLSKQFFKYTRDRNIYNEYMVNVLDTDQLTIFTKEVISKISNNVLYDEPTPTQKIFNVIIKYYNNEDYLDLMDELEFEDNNTRENYYLIPIILYILGLNI